MDGRGARGIEKGSWGRRELKERVRELKVKRWGAGKESRIAGWEGRRAEGEMRRGELGVRAEE